MGLVTLKKMNYLFKNSFYSLVVKDGDQVVAFCMTHAAGINYNSPNYIWHSQNSTDPDFVYIDRIVVDENYQRMKIGTKIYNRLEQFLKQKGVHTICAEVNRVPPNPASLQFHLRNNFEMVKKAHMHEEGYVVDFIVKKLGQPAAKKTKKQEPAVEPVKEKVNKIPLEEEQVEFRCNECKKDFNSEYNLHVH